MQMESSGAEDWPVLFTSFLQDSHGQWRETDGREPITDVLVEGDEVLLVRDPTKPVLTLSALVDRLTRLVERCAGFDVDSCETPIEMDDGLIIHIDLSITGAGRDEQDKAYLVVFCAKEPGPDSSLS